MARSIAGIQKNKTTFKLLRATTAIFQFWPISTKKPMQVLEFTRASHKKI
jgi:hypothetical protein